MKAHFLLAGCALLVLAASTKAQTKVSATEQCPKADPMYSVEVGDHPGHIMLLEKLTCTWSKPMELGGENSKDALNVVSADVTATKGSSHGSGVTTMESGDKAFATFRDTGAVVNGKVPTIRGTWSFTGGTGKLRGIKGKGTYVGTANEDGSTTVEVEGEYELPAAKPATKK